MRLFVYVAFNLFLRCTGQPKFDDHSPDVFSKSFERMLMTSEESKAFSFENTVWYQLGEYDDESMEFKALKAPLKLLDCNAVLDERKLKLKIISAAREAVNSQDGKDEIDETRRKFEELDQ